MVRRCFGKRSSLRTVDGSLRCGSLVESLSRACTLESLTVIHIQWPWLTLASLTGKFSCRWIVRCDIFVCLMSVHFAEQGEVLVEDRQPRNEETGEHSERKVERNCGKPKFWSPVATSTVLTFHTSARLQASSAKYLKEPEPINFAAYQKKLKFTGSAVQALEVNFCGTHFREATDISAHYSNRLLTRTSPCPPTTPPFPLSRPRSAL